GRRKHRLLSSLIFPLLLFPTETQTKPLSESKRRPRALTLSSLFFSSHSLVSTIYRNPSHQSAALCPTTPPSLLPPRLNNQNPKTKSNSPLTSFFFLLPRKTNQG
ncbi:unnamed protein product, partial [Linum tenue]